LLAFGPSTRQNNLLHDGALPAFLKLGERTLVHLRISDCAPEPTTKNFMLMLPWHGELTALARQTSLETHSGFSPKVDDNHFNRGFTYEQYSD
jgi:hypothetical protein